MKKLVWIVLAALLSASGAWAQGTITRGALELTFNADIDNPSAGNVDLLWNGVDQLSQLWFWYRCDGDTMETPVPLPLTQEYGTNGIASLVWTNLCPPLIAAAEIQLRDCSTDVCAGGGRGPWGEVVVQFLLFGAEMTYMYFDFDVGGDAGSDVAAALGTAGIHVRDGDTTADAEVFTNPLATALQVTPFSALRDALNNASATDLDGSGLPFGPGDFTGAFAREDGVTALISVDRTIFVDGFESGDTLSWSSTTR